ncbi:MAG: hypothetical protein Q4P72_06255 [Eubacteriales bacterium]|nr:hypothetical protein [Eubacteriales bacterium]
MLVDLYFKDRIFAQDLVRRLSATSRSHRYRILDRYDPHTPDSRSNDQTILLYCPEDFPEISNIRERRQLAIHRPAPLRCRHAARVFRDRSHPYYLLGAHQQLSMDSSCREILTAVARLEEDLDAYRMRREKQRAAHIELYYSAWNERRGQRLAREAVEYGLQAGKTVIYLPLMPAWAIDPILLVEPSRLKRGLSELFFIQEGTVVETLDLKRFLSLTAIEAYSFQPFRRATDLSLVDPESAAIVARAIQHQFSDPRIQIIIELKLLDWQRFQAFFDIAGKIIDVAPQDQNLRKFWEEDLSDLRSKYPKEEAA